MSYHKIPRKAFLTSLSIVTGATLFPSFLRGAIVAPNHQELLKCDPYLQAPRQNEITIRWLTNKPVYSWVEYGEELTGLDKLHYQSTNGLVNADSTIQAITISGLKPGKTYHYRVFSKEILEFKPYKITYGETYSSEISSFKTLKTADEACEIWIMNDIHDRPESFHHLLKFHKPICDFIFLNGDMFNWQKDEQQLIDHLIEPLIEASDQTIPFILSRGNHETRGAFARALPTYFNDVDVKYYYAFVHGPMYIIVLDSGEDKMDDHPEYGGIVDFDNYREQQKHWLEKEVEKVAFKEAKYKIVFSHIPLFYAGSGHGVQHCRDLWGPILNAAKISVLISGHTHVYGIHPPKADEHTYPVIIGGGPLDGIRTLIKLKSDHQGMQAVTFNDHGVLLDTLNL
jgi:UDP-2,3-diacylglucosamine pyrophosphatase LpxH